MFTNLNHISQRQSTRTTSSTAAATTTSPTVSTTPAASSSAIYSPLPQVLHGRQTKMTQPSYHRNQQYSIIGISNAAGTLVERYRYSAYGTLGIFAADGTARTTSTYANRYTYTGREYDAELALYHFRIRWYDPATGGFISRAPLGYVDGMSLYRLDGVTHFGKECFKVSRESKTGSATR